MARITVEDCVLKVPSRFELVMLAAQRARDMSAGAPLTVERDNDKNPVVALREIADETVDLDHLRYELIHGLRRHVSVPDEMEEQTLRMDHLRVSDEQISIQESESMPINIRYDDDVAEDQTPEEGFQ